MISMRINGCMQLQEVAGQTTASTVPSFSSANINISKRLQFSDISAQSNFKNKSLEITFLPFYIGDPVLYYQPSLVKDMIFLNYWVKDNVTVFEMCLFAFLHKQMRGKIISVYEDTGQWQVGWFCPNVKHVAVGKEAGYNLESSRVQAEQPPFGGSIKNCDSSVSHSLQTPVLKCPAEQRSKASVQPGTKNRLALYCQLPCDKVFS